MAFALTNVWLNAICFNLIFSYRSINTRFSWLSMMSSDVLGLVVVGVGLAGKFRIKDILKEATSEKPFLKNVKLIGYVSRFVISCFYVS